MTDSIAPKPITESRQVGVSVAAILAGIVALFTQATTLPWVQEHPQFALWFPIIAGVAGLILRGITTKPLDMSGMKVVVPKGNGKYDLLHVIGAALIGAAGGVYIESDKTPSPANKPAVEVSKPADTVSTPPIQDTKK